jgi:hypothetical protein
MKQSHPIWNWLIGIALVVIPLLIYTLGLPLLLAKSDSLPSPDAESRLATKNLMALVQTNNSRLFGPVDKQAAVVKRMLESEQIAVYSKLEGATVYIPLVEMFFLGRPLYLIEIHPYELALFLERQEDHTPLSVAYPHTLSTLRCTSEVSVLPPPESQTEFVFCE